MKATNSSYLYCTFDINHKEVVDQQKTIQLVPTSRDINNGALDTLPWMINLQLVVLWFDNSKRVMFVPCGFVRDS